MRNQASFNWFTMVQVQDTLNVAVEKVCLEILRDTVRAAPRRTGNLARSYTIVDGYTEGNTVTKQVVTNVFYARYQEFGTSRHAARPHLGPALEKARRKYGR